MPASSQALDLRPVPRSLPQLSPLLLGLSLGAGALLAVGGRALEATDSVGSWLVAWSVAAALAVVAGLRSLAPSPSGPLRGALWLGSGLSGAALLGRHAIDALLLAAAEAPWSAPVLGPVDLADLTLVLALSLLLGAAGLGDLLRSRRPSLGVGAVCVVAGLAVVGVASSQQAFAAAAGPSAADLRLSPVVVALSLAWLGALVGPASLPPSPGRSLRQGLLPLLAVSAMLGLGAWWLLSVHRVGGLLRADGVLLAHPGALAFGTWGDRIGAGFEAATCLFAVVAVLVLSGRLAARDLPGLRSAVLPLLGAVAALGSALLPLSVLVPAGFGLGWAAVLVGVERPTEGGALA